MFFRKAVAIALLCLLGQVYAQMEPPAPMPAEAARLLEVYKTALTALADDYNKALIPMAEQYAIGLLQLARRMQDEKDRAGAEAVRQEAQRYKKALTTPPDAFESVPEMTREDIVEKPEALRIIQEEYAGARTLNDLKLQKRCTELAQKLIAALTQLQNSLTTDNKSAEAAIARKESIRLQAALQRKDFSARALQEAGAKIATMPDLPDFAALSQKAISEPPAQTRNLAALSLVDLSATIQAFLIKPLDYDKDWPPPITKWVYEGTGNYAHDFALYKQPGQPDELGIFAYDKTMRAYVRGTIKYGAYKFDNKTLNWMGKAAAWQLTDSRDLICRIIFRTKRPAISENGGPAGCVAVYSTSEANRLIASMSVPLLNQESSLRMAKHYSHNRLNIAWEGSKRKRGFTIPDHMPLRVVVGVAGFAPGEQIDATFEIIDCPQVEDMW